MCAKQGGRPTHDTWQKKQLSDSVLYAGTYFAGCLDTAVTRHPSMHAMYGGALASAHTGVDEIHNVLRFSMLWVPSL